MAVGVLPADAAAASAAAEPPHSVSTPPRSPSVEARRESDPIDAADEAAAAVAAAPFHADGAPSEPQAKPDACARHEVLYGSLYADLAPWIDRGLSITPRQMAEAINFIDAHRGKWDSWVTDTLTPLLIKDGRLYLTLGPPTKDPTNYFWTVLKDLQQLASTRRLPDAELLLNFADTPVVYAADDGEPTSPRLPVFSYCKRDRFLDVLVPGYYTPDRTCASYTGRNAGPRVPWKRKLRKAFARYTHFCKQTKQADAYGRPLPPCSRSYFASLGATEQGRSRLDVMPMNVVNDTTDPSLAYGQRLLRAGKKLAMADHGRYAYLLDTDGFTSAYKLQQLLATDSAVLHHRSPWYANRGKHRISARFT